MTRGWVEQARKAGQTVGPSAPDGTFAAGVNRVTELLPSFMSDIITNAPEEQKVRLLESSTRAKHRWLASYCWCTSNGPSWLSILNLSPVHCVNPDSRMFLHLRLGL